MATFFNPPQFGTEYIFYVSLISQADANLMQANPTLAAGDVKVATGDAAPVNLNTLPVVDADFTKRVKVTVSAAEMLSENVTLIFSDAAGAEWADFTINIHPSIIATSMTRGTIDSTSFPPTATQFECDDITKSTADHFKGKIVHFVIGVAGANLRVQESSDITAYSLVGGKGRFTVTALTVAPVDNAEVFIV